MHLSSLSIPLLITLLITLLSQSTAQDLDALIPPILYSRNTTLSEDDLTLHKRETCPGGTGRCLIGQCCGDGCASVCCAHDEGGVGCDLTERCQFRGNVFIGCCGNLIGGCTGEATRITVHSPHTLRTLTTDDVLSLTAPTTTRATTTTSTSTFVQTYTFFHKTSTETGVTRSTTTDDEETSSTRSVTGTRESSTSETESGTGSRTTASETESESEVESTTTARETASDLTRYAEPPAATESPSSGVRGVKWDWVRMGIVVFGGWLVW